MSWKGDIVDILRLRLYEMGCESCSNSEMNNPALRSFDKRRVKCSRCLEGQSMWSITEEKAEEIAEEILGELV